MYRFAASNNKCTNFLKMDYKLINKYIITILYCGHVDRTSIIIHLIQHDAPVQYSILYHVYKNPHDVGCVLHFFKAYIHFSPTFITFSLNMQAVRSFRMSEIFPPIMVYGLPRKPRNLPLSIHLKNTRIHFFISSCLKDKLLENNSISSFQLKC